MAYLKGFGVQGSGFGEKKEEDLTQRRGERRGKKEEDNY